MRNVVGQKRSAEIQRGGGNNRVRDSYSYASGAQVSEHSARLSGDGDIDGERCQTAKERVGYALIFVPHSLIYLEVCYGAYRQKPFLSPIIEQDFGIVTLSQEIYDYIAIYDA